MVKLKNLKNNELIELAYEKALEVINECSTKNGLYASGGKNGYKGVWSRDSVISLIGAGSDIKSNELVKDQLKRSLEILGRYQSELGQIPNAVLGFEEKKIKADFQTIDSNLWWIIGNYYYAKKFDKKILKKNEKKIERAITWLRYQDVGEDILLNQLPTTDWQDAFPQKYGHTINTQALYCFVLKLVGDNKRLGILKKNVNDHEDLQLWAKDYYYAYRWKNHNKYREIGDWFDSLGNLIAIIFDLADKKKAKKILEHIKKKKINQPYSLKAIYPAIKKGSIYWQDYYLDCEAGKAYHYLNGGIWPFIGGFYILALIKMKMYGDAKEELEKFARCCLKGNIFPEWIDPKSKTTHGKLQAWSAGMYICAYNSLEEKKVLF
jgi:glycogen debranching enzyme